MQILSIDIGTGTQDIFLYDSQLDMENSIKLVLPSPTMMIYRRIQEATRLSQPILLTGVTMGGGPSAWAAEAHLKAGHAIYATPDAARSFNDHLDEVAAMGIELVSEEEAAHLPDQIQRVELKDFDFNGIYTVLTRFGVSLKNLAAIAVAVFDHGAAPPGISDRQFRFDYLDQRIRQENRLSAFAYLSGEIPAIMTRLQSVVQSAGRLPAPLIVMDTAPAAVLGALFDPLVSKRERTLIANIGNFHTLAFRLGPGGIEGVFEHHTGLVNQSRLVSLIRRLADSTLQHRDVFEDHGHGALVYSSVPLSLDHQTSPDYGIVVTGPRRSMLANSDLRPYFAVPFGDMMMTGCIGLLSAIADSMPELADSIRSSLISESGAGKPPWEVQH